MELMISCKSMKDVREAHGMLAGILGIREDMDKQPPLKKTKTPRRKKTPEPEQEEIEMEMTVEIPDEKGTTPAVTRESLLAHIKANYSSNIQPIKDMLARLGANKVSEIPESQLEKAMGLLTKEG